MSHAHDLSWCAGFFDGEGYITIQRRRGKYKDKEYIGHYLRIGINHVAPEPLKEMHRVLGGTFTYDKSSEKLGKDLCKRKPRYKWLTSCDKAASVLRQLMPYFKNKNQVAELAIEFQKTMQAQGQGVSLEVRDIREAFKKQITLLNSKD